MGSKQNTVIAAPHFPFLLPHSYETAVIVPSWSQGPRGEGLPYSHASRHWVWWGTQGHEGLPWNPRGTHTHTADTHTHTYKEQSRRAQMHAKRRADTCKPTRHVQYTYEHTNRQINTKAGGCTYSLAHLNTHRHWQSIKNTANRGLTQTQTRWYSLAQQLAITSNI